MKAENDGKFRQKQHTENRRQRKYDALERSCTGDARRWFRARPYALQYQEQIKKSTGGKKDV